ncbi:MAG: peptide chain release factor 2 [Gammaproteobacteria bacterium]|nr:peptide chain release factor 2 [Gammaproteobacteria bacterium]
MLDRSVIKSTIKNNKKLIESINEVFDIEKVNMKIAELEKAQLDASFWLDQKSAKDTIVELNDLKDKASIYNSLLSDIEMLELISSMDEISEDEEKEALDSISHFLSSYEELECELLLKEKEDKLDAIIDIHSGAGGTESLDWSSMLFRMYEMYASSHKYKLEILDYQEGDEVGIKSVTFKLSGRYAYGMLKSESGIHRLVRLSPFDASHSRHTTFASVYVSPLIDESIEIDLKDEDLRIDIFHSSGAGGQGVNTSFSAVRVTHIPTGTVVTCQNERSQIQNKATALKVLRSRLYQMELDKRREELLKSQNKSSISFGSQIRSYVFHPYSLVKDHRTEYETSQTDKVMNGELDEFIKAYLKMEAKDE